MRIAVAGSSGFLGSRLVGKLRADGHEVVRLVRRPPRDPSEARWDPAGRVLDPTVLSTVDAAVNLAGVNVAGRWTGAYRRRIRDSRVDSTATLAHALAAAEPRPGVLLNASAIGYYGDTGDRPVDEQSPPGEGFLADVCRAWEAATAPAEDAGVRVVHLRTGLPLDPGGGLLKPMLLPFRLGLGGPLGNGRQYWPWISMPDWLGAVRFLLDRADLAGPVNLTAPQPVTNAEFTRALGGVLHRPAVLPVPAPALRLALGGFASEALGSRRVLPAVLNRSGYAFQHRDVTAALTSALR
jgi:uncharacterized protein